MFRLFKKGYRVERGFTLVELLVSVAIFVMMTGLLVAKYGTFNQSVLLTNLAYDVALTIRTAQTFGLSVKSSTVDPNQKFTAFNYAYGVQFNTQTTTCAGGSTGVSAFTMFADANGNKLCDSSSSVDFPVSSYSLKRGAVIYRVCGGSSSGCILSTTGRLDITFKRPDPSANICFQEGTNPVVCNQAYAKIEVKATDGGLRIIEVRSNGQISVQD